MISNKFEILAMILSWFLLVSCNFSIREISVDKRRLSSDDYRIYQETPVWDLAKAVQDGDLYEIEYIVKKNPKLIDYKENKYNHSLLSKAIINDDFDSAKKLIELGANLRSSYEYVANIQDTKYLKLFIKHGDPNIGSAIGAETPLMDVCNHLRFNPIEHVKLLVEAGADMNYRNESGHSVLGVAFTMENMEVVLYLLESGADYKSPVSVVEGKKFFIQDELRFVFLKLNSTQHKFKMEVVDFLKEKGIDYRATPIPKAVLEKAKRAYPNSWQEYLEKY